MITDKKTFYLSLAILVFSFSGLTPFWKLILVVVLTLTLMLFSVQFKMPSGLPKRLLSRTNPEPTIVPTLPRVDKIISRPAHRPHTKKEVAPQITEEVVPPPEVSVPAVHPKKVAKRKRNRVKKKNIPQITEDNA